MYLSFCCLALDPDFAQTGDSFLPIPPSPIVPGNVQESAPERGLDWGGGYYPLLPMGSIPSMGQKCQKKSFHLWTAKIRSNLFLLQCFLIWDSPPRSTHNLIL